MSNRPSTRLTAKVLAFVLFASTLAVVPFVSTVSAQSDPVEWECNGTPILMRGGVLHNILPDPNAPGNLIIDPVPGTSGIWNSTAFNPLNNLVYGAGSIGGVDHIRSYDATGAIIDQIPIQAPYPSAANQFAGTFLGDGRYILHSVGGGNATTQTGWFNGNRFNLWSIDAATGASTYIGPTPVNFADFAYNPADGFLYQPVNRVLYRVDPNTGAITTQPTSTVLPNGSFGASWFDAAGNLFVFRNNPGDIWRIDPANPQDVTLVGSPGSNGGTDGTNCVSSIDLTKDVVDATGAVAPADRIYGPGDTVTYEFTLINNGVPTQNLVVDLCDVLPLDGRTYTGVWTSTDPATTVTSGGNAGDTSICFEANMPSSLFTDPAQPGSPPTVITVDVVLGPDVIPGTLENQAELDFDQDGTTDVLSDDIGDGSDPRDPTTIQVLGGFTISKTVEGHPVDDGTDSFDVTLVCTAADGSIHDVAASSILDATTGAPWPGATTNGFTFADGDDVHISDVPAGTTCTTTEAPDAGYTATSVSSDAATGGSGATSTGTLTSDLVNDNCQDGDGGFVPFNLQVRNTTNQTQVWETIWRNRPYSTIPNLNPGNYTHTVVPAAGGLFDHVFTGTTPLNAFGNITITGGVPNPLGSDQGCGDVENYNGVGSGTGGTGGAAPSPSADITVDEALSDETIDYTNATSTLGIRKATTAGGDLPLDEDGTFTFDLTCSNGLSETVTITTVGGSGSISYPDTPLIAAGVDCTLGENVPAGWELVSANDVEFTSEAGTQEGIGFRNERQLADLTIEKVILGLPDDIDPTSLKFEVTVTCVGGFDPDPYTISAGFAVGEPLVVPDLPVGAECTVTETPADGFNIRYSPAQTVQIDADGETVQVTNSTGSLIIEKNTEVTSTHPIDPTGSFEFALECTGPGGSFSETYVVDADSLIANGATGGVSHTDVGVLAPGTTCTVTETDGDVDWTLDGPATQTLTITDDVPEPTASFLNVRDTGDLTITKTLEGVPDGLDLGDEPFTVDVSCSGGFTVDPYLISGQVVTANTPLVITDLPTGAECTVTEQPDPRFTATGSPSTVTIDTDGETVPITNTTSGITFQKRTTSSDLVDDIDGTFNFTVVCEFDGVEIVNTATSITTTAGGGVADAASLPLVPPGSECTITELVPAGWTIIQQVGGTPVGSNAIEFTTPLTENIGFQNELDTATLTLAKDVTGVAATPALEGETFTVQVVCTGNFPGGAYDSGPLSIVEGTPVEIDGLPVGAECTVTEETDGRFVTTYLPVDTVTIADGDNEVTIENETSRFTISKETFVDGDVVDGTFEFVIECTVGGAVVFSETVLVTTDDSLGLWDESPFLAPGTECSVTETLVPGWTLQEATTQTITTVGSNELQVVFTNIRNVADLTVTKTLLGIPDDLNFDDEPFIVDVTCVGDFATSPLVLTDQTLTSNTPLVVPDLPTGTVCTVVEDFDSRFQTLYAPENADGTAAEVTIADGGTEAGVINSGGVIAIQKETVGPADHPLGLLTEVDYDLTCDNGYSEIWTVDVDQLSGGQGIGAITWTELPVFPIGTVCTITEIVPDGWTLTSPNPQVVTVSEDPQTTEWTNTRDTGTLTINKLLDGVPVEIDLNDEAFAVTVTCTGGGLTEDPYVLSDLTVTANTPLVIDNLPTDAICSVAEDADPRFTSAVGADVTIDADGEAIDITNASSTFSITKTTTGPTTHPIVLDESFDFDITCIAPDGTTVFSGAQTITTSGQTGTWAAPDTPLLPPGTTCSVTEQTPPAGWTNTGDATVDIVTDSATVLDAAFTNERDTASLTITKTVTGSPTDLSDEEFIVDVSCTGGFTTDPHLISGLVVTENAPVVIPDLPTGAACVVVEQADPRFNPSYSPDDATAIVGQDGSSVDIDNRTGTFIVEKLVEADSAQPIDLNETFLIDVTCTDGTAFTLTMEVTNGVGVTTATGDIPLLPEGTGCTVSEQTPPTGWTLTSANDIEIIISSSAEPTVSFTNTRDTADLTFSKAVIGAPANLDVSALTFTVDVSCSGDFASSPLIFADQSIGDGETVTISDLPTGAVCTVIEDADPRFATTYAPVDAATVGVEITDAGADVAIVNATGEIMIVKNTQVTSGLPVDITESFDFLVDCGATYSGTHTVDADTVTSATTATGFLRYSDLPALPNGTDCTVTEQAAPAGWTLTSANDVALTVDSNGVAVAEFTNERDTGELTVNKILDGVPAGTDLDAELFDLTITCAGGFTSPSHSITGQFSVDEPFVLTNIPTGAECSAVEAPDARFSTTSTGDVVVATAANSIDITNTTSTLSITKTTTGPDTHPLDLDDTFSFEVSCVAPDGTVLFSGTQSITTSGQNGTWATPATPLLPPGTECTITENAAIGWTALTTSPVVVTTDSAGIVDAAFENERDTGSVDINKILDGVPAGTDLDAELFDITVTCSGGFATSTHVVNGQISVDAPLVITDLPTGASCSAVETPDPRFATSTSGAVVIVQQGESIDITNTTSTLSITKTTTGPDTQPLDLDDTFTFDVECTNAAGTVLFAGTQTITTSGQTGTWATPATPLLPPGTECSITEQTPPTGWTNTSGLTATVTTGSAAIVDAAFTNDRDVSDLNITKTVIGAPSNLDVAALTFTIDISCTGDFTNSPLVFADEPIGDGGTITISDLPTGAVCTVDEDPDPRFQTTVTPVDAPTVGVTLDADGEDVAFVNATGEIMIVKNTQVTSGLPVDITESFDFLVDCGATYSGTHTVDAETVTSATTATGFLRYSDLPALPNGTDCTVTEQAPPAGWTLVSPNDVALTVDSDGVAVAEFTNERDTGELTVNKILDGVPAGTDLDAELFDITVTCTGGFTTPTHTITGQFSVDEPLVIPGVPTSADCTAVEAPDARFSTTSTADVVVDTAGNSIDITNTTSTLSITKTTTGPDTQPLDLDDTFSFEVSCVAPDGTVLFSGTQSITTSGQTGTWATPATPLLPPGTECTITENAATGWTALTVSPVVVTTDSTGIVDAAFENERETGELTINKILDGVPAGTDLDAELFDVTVTCTGGFATSTHVVNGQISVDASLVIPDLPSNATCSAVEAPDARFATTSSADVVVETTGNSIDITNTTSTLSITKTTTGPDTHPLDLDETFEFDVVCTNAVGTELFAGTQTITTTDQLGSWTTPATPLLPPGTLCSVTEQAPPVGWTNTSGENVEVTTDSAGIVDAAFVNERDTAELSITKTVLGAPEGVDLTETFFDVTVTCTDGFTTDTHIVTGQVNSVAPLVISDLPTGSTCEIVEADDARFNTTYAPDNGLGTGAVATIVDGGSVAQITNSTGAIIVAKETVVPASHPIDPVGDFTFTIDCGAVYSGDHTITTDALTATGAMGVIFYTDLPLLPEGTVCDITEHDETPAWTLATDRTITLTATSANPVTAEFINDATIGSVVIDKIIEGPDGFDLSADEFEVTVTCSGNFTENPYVLTGVISEIEPWTINELPYGADCTAVETPDPRFTTSYTSTDSDDAGAVTITTEPSAVSVLNQTGSFHVDIETLVSSARPFDPDDTFSFTVTCSNGDDVIYEELVEASTADGFSTWEAILLPTGSTCETALDPAVGWTLTGAMGEAVTDDVIGQTIGTDVAWNGFEVERELASLSVTKLLEDIPFNADFTAETFELTVTCADGFTEPDHQLAEQLTISTLNPLTVENLPVNATCTIAEVENPFFDPSFAPNDTFVVSSDSAINSINAIALTNIATEALSTFLEAQQPPPSPLAFTGRTVWSLVWLAVLLLAAGMFLVVSRRKDDEELTGA